MSKYDFCLPRNWFTQKAAGKMWRDAPRVCSNRVLKIFTSEGLLKNLHLCVPRPHIWSQTIDRQASLPASVNLNSQRSVLHEGQETRQRCVKVRYSHILTWSDEVYEILGAKPVVEQVDVVETCMLLSLATASQPLDVDLDGDAVLLHLCF